jgi:hypothetical protein
MKELTLTTSRISILMLFLLTEETTTTITHVFNFIIVVIVDADLLLEKGLTKFISSNRLWFFPFINWILAITIFIQSQLNT